MTSFPKIMGILNVTPDSFSDGGKYFSRQSAIEQGMMLIEEGADILDIGGESTRPGAAPVTQAEEIIRVAPVIEALAKHKPDIPISIDTTKYEVALEAVSAGASIINDISGLTRAPKLAEIAADKNLALIIMHIQGEPQNMQNNPHYNNVVSDVYAFLKDRVEFARKVGVNKIFTDVGIGFGKALEHNLELLRNLSKFNDLADGTVLGISRKSFIGKILDIPEPVERDLATALIHSLLLNSGVSIIRVHNISYLVQLKNLFNSIYVSEYGIVN